MPTRERRQREYQQKADRPGQYGDIDTGYLFASPEFQAMPPLFQYAEILGWMAAFFERDDVLKVEWLTKICRRVDYKETKRRQRLVEVMTKRGCWEILPDGSLKILKIKEKRPNFPWKSKGQNGQNEGTKRHHSKSNYYPKGNLPFSGQVPSGADAPSWTDGLIPPDSEVPKQKS